MKRNLKRTLALALSVLIIAVAALPAMAAENGTVNITILGTSDVHGRFVPWDYASDTANKNGSLSQINTLVKQVRAENPNTILVDAGDEIQDNYCELFKDYPSNPMVTAMNEMNYDIWVMGNHEYNFQPAVLNRTIAAFKGTAMSGNVYKKDGSRYLPATKIIEKGGVKIGIVGLTTPMISTFEKNTGTLKDLDVHDAISEAKKAVEELSGKVDCIVGVIHMGEDNENGIAGTGVTDIIKAVPGFNVIVAGHMHQNISGKDIDGVLVTEPYKYGQNLSRVDLTFTKAANGYTLTDKTAKTIDVKNVESDKTLENSLSEYHQYLRNYINKPIGKLTGGNLVAPDDIKGISTVQTEATPLFNLFTEVGQYYSKAQIIALGTDIDHAILNAGDIRIKDIAYNYTYTGGEYTVYKMSGADLKKYMEWSAGYFGQLKPGDITVSYNPNRRNSKYSTNDFFGGMTYKIDLTKPEGTRIQDMKLANGTPIKSDTIVTIGMNSYRLEGLQKKGGIFEGKAFSSTYSSIKVFGEDQGTVRNLTMKYIQQVKKGVIKPNTKKNWEIVGIDKNSMNYKKAKVLVNSGKLSLHNTTDGKYTNVASITVKDLEPFKDVNISLPSGAPATSDNSKAYTVISGDTLWNLAKKFGTTVNALTVSNKISNPNRIYAGQVIYVP